MTEWENLREVLLGMADGEETKRAQVFVDKLEAAVVKTQEWIDNKDFVPRTHNGQIIPLKNAVVNIGPKTRAVFDAIKSVQP